MDSKIQNLSSSDMHAQRPATTNKNTHGICDNIRGGTRDVYEGQQLHAFTGNHESFVTSRVSLEHTGVNAVVDRSMNVFHIQTAIRYGPLHNEEN